MKPRVLFVVTSDPRSSARPAEAVRIAAGIGPWQKLDLAVYLRGAAVLALGECVEELVDADHFGRYLPILGEMERPVYVERGTPWLAGLRETPVRFAEMDDVELARLAADSGCVLRF
jgi:hypothetical protein